MISFKIFKGIPIEFEPFLIEKYDSFITTCRYIEVNFTAYDVNYMLVYDNDILIELLIFGNIGNTSTCFNSLVYIEQDIIDALSQKIFEKYPLIKKVELVASYKTYSLNKSFLNFKSDDQILNLPSTIEAYYSLLGYHTRKNIKNRKVRLSRDYPTVQYVTKFGVEIEQSIVDKIIQLNCDRMKHKGKTSGIDNIDKNNIYQYSQYYGCVTYIEIDGAIVAGCIATILNKGAFAHVIAHDNNFYKYNLGELCIFNLIQISIEKKLSTFHFLWGENELKKRLLAKSHLLFSYFVYRTFSLDYVITKTKIMISGFLINIQHSALSKPIRTAIKSYRKKDIK